MKVPRLLFILPILYICVIWFLFAKPYIIEQKIPFPSTYLVNQFIPWSLYEEFWSPVKNDAIPDVLSQLYPWKKITIDSFKAGSIPLWNPHSFSGTPHIANYQSAAFSPFNLLFFILPFSDAWSVLILLQPLLAGVFMYMYMRVLKIGIVSSLIGSTAFMFCGFIVVWMAYGTLSMVIACLPLMLFAIEKAMQTKRIVYLNFLSVAVVLSLFSGHFQTSLYSLFVITLYIGFHFYLQKDRRLLFFSLLYVVLGILLAMPQLLPTAELYLQSQRGDSFNTGGGLPYSVLVTLFAPDFYGNPVTRNATIYYVEWASFIGIIPFFLACVACSIKQRSQLLFFQILAIVSLILSLDTPIQLLIQNLHIPVLSTTIPSRMIVIFSFSLCVLAGYGMDIVIHAIKEKNIRRIILPLSLLGVVIFGLWIILFGFRLLPGVELSVAKRNLLLPTAFFIILAISIAGTLFLRVRYKGILVAILLLLITSFDSLRFAQKWMPFEDTSLLYPEISSIQEIKNKTGNNRVFGRLGNEIVNYFEILGLEGYDPLYSKRYGEFIRSSATGKYTPAERSVVIYDKVGKYVNKVNDLLGVTVIFHPKSDTIQSWAFPVTKDKKRFTRFYEDKAVELYTNNAVLERPKLYYSYEVVSDEKKLLQRFFDKTFNIENTILLEEQVNLPTKNKGSGEAEFTSYSPNTVKIKTKTDIPAILFLSDAYYPGWKAYIGNKETKIYRANYAFRSIIIPQGSHTVIFRYEPQSFYIGVVLMICGVVGLCMLTLLLKYQQVSRKPQI